MTARHIGVVGCSPPGAALCYQLVSSEASTIAQQSGLEIEVSVHSHAFSDYTRHIDADDWDGVAGLMLSSAHKLAKIGAEIVLAPCNTIHKAFDRVAMQSPLPWLHIGTEVAAEAKRQGFRRIALLGTRLTMEENIYSSRLESSGIEYCIPDKADRERLDQHIFQEMVRGDFTAEARQFVTGLIREMHSAGCDAAGLCCTELPILLSNIELPIPALDSTRILAQGAIKHLGEST